MIDSNTKKNGISIWRLEFLVVLFLFISTLSVYIQVKDFEFVSYDDNLYVTENTVIQSGFSVKNFLWTFKSFVSSNWHPFTLLSHLTDVQLFGMASGGHHLTNLLFHIINTLLLFYILKKLTGELWQSSFVAALFALHPLHVESVAWISERKDVLSTFFLLMTIWNYNKYTTNRNLTRYFISLMFFASGLMAKPMLVTLPFLLLLLDYWPIGRFNKKRSSHPKKEDSTASFVLKLVLEKTPFFILSGIFCIVTFLVQQKCGSVISITSFPIGTRLVNSLISYSQYVYKMIWPVNFAVFYPYPDNFSYSHIIISIIFLLVITLLAGMNIKKRPWIIVGWLWYLGTMVPVIGIIQVGLQAMADRYTYIPLIGIFIIMSWSTKDFFYKYRSRIPKAIPVTAATILLSGLMIITWAQVRYWSNSITLYKHAINVTENNSLAHFNLGSVFYEQDNKEKALHHYYEALRIDPECAFSHYTIGGFFLYYNEIEKAFNHYSKAINICPEYPNAHNDIGIVLIKKGQIKTAIYHFQRALQLNPYFADARKNLGLAMEITTIIHPEKNK